MSSAAETGMQSGPSVQPASYNVQTTIDRLIHRIANESGVADIDVSGPEFDFIRSIQVWHIEEYRHKEGGDGACVETHTILTGTYGLQGAFTWTPSEPDLTPEWILPATERVCTSWFSSYRAVGVSWTDFEGIEAYEVFTY